MNLTEALSYGLAQRLPLLALGSTPRMLPRLFLLTAGYACAAVSLYVFAGLGSWSPSFSPAARSIALIVGFFFLPSLAEELLWRWLMIPPDCLGRIDRRSIRAVLVSTALFTAAHPLAGAVFVPHAWGLFSDPFFLAIVALLGLTCGAAYVMTRSIWPSVAIHWITVLAWKFLLGGPFVLLGR